MTSYQDLFAIGQTFDDFVRHGLPDEIDAVWAVQRKLASPEALSAGTRHRLAALDDAFFLLAAGEMWCPDCQINLAVMDSLQRFAPSVTLSIITKARAEDALKTHLALERVAIPFVLVLDRDFQVIGRFVERPDAVVQGGDALKPAYRAGLYVESTVEDLLAIFEHAR
ncbi:thioredoxin family protein [Pseudomonas sp. GD03842]|uniref:thioredoxin family protein n=1 Tax=Pseudomonas sp. GD03842 TaxID=2975385 RepID=UPI0024490E31|nr:thioredoxin family protein [Pseudomonas sp. GD03842]MDH0747039.1 thioredoxin family protein [Pseudomonas sp. GD03842]